MRMRIEIDDELLRKAMVASCAESPSQAVEAALKMFIQVRAQAGIRELRGTVEWEL
jgi:Arc/MetJ family transcription regulator